MENVLKHYVDSLRSSALKATSREEAESLGAKDGVRLARVYFRQGAGIAGRQTAEEKLVAIGALQPSTNGSGKTAHASA